MEQVLIDNEQFFKISNSDQLRPFFMSIVSDANHWMFISSNGGLTAGRKNAQYAFFPYYTDDKITESADITGSKTILQVATSQGSKEIWEPFSHRQSGKYKLTRNLYKNIYGNKVLFEEINHDLQLIFRYQWASSNRFGFVREATLINDAQSNASIVVLDGLQNIVPFGVGSELQNRASNLVDAYKRNELIEEAGLGIYALSAIIVDKAEPSEALKANVAWSIGMEDSIKLVSSLQLNDFRSGLSVKKETDVKGEKGAYFLQNSLNLQSKEVKKWHIIANVNQDHSDVVSLLEGIRHNKKLKEELLADIALGTNRLIDLNASSDGLQKTADNLRDTRHFSNTLFNIMRGGIFDDDYNIERPDLLQYLQKANTKVFEEFKGRVNELPAVFKVSDLHNFCRANKNPDLERLCIEYLPLKFSRRHGDPSRPWNIFSINTYNELDGSKILDYQGNWRDIFQNWEALAHAYPSFMEGMILKFFNATTFEGYNPYRVTKDGFDWETIEPDDPWSYIGYWGDHQIIYSLKFLEFIEKHDPNALRAYFDKEIFVYANVPYKIKPYEEILKNPKDTIDFDHSLDEKIRKQKEELGGDAALLQSQNGSIHRVNFIEKMLASVLVKISNFIPEGGIWLNTQRPEWNDANNALVGNGVSMVTLYYLRRYFGFFHQVFEQIEEVNYSISSELLSFFHSINKTIEKHKGSLSTSFTNAQRRQCLNELGTAASDFRTRIYEQSFSGKKDHVSLSELKEFTNHMIAFFDHSIKANKREDGLYHAYNLMTVEKDGGVSISYLSEMLEGQVAVLSSGKLSGNEALEVLDALKASALFREDQYSYILYPNKELPRFLEKNTIPKKLVDSSTLIGRLLKTGDLTIVEQDVRGGVHFNGNFKNANDLSTALNQIKDASSQEKEQLLEIFEEIFDHKSFTGRSGTFFGYEGLGSIYWHMVSKLLLAVQECCLKAIEAGDSPEIIGRLMEHYYEINEGIGVHKSPELYGAFPTDPYSHTPAGKGAQQPGMTGQVKEDVLSRFGELGVRVKDGKLYFAPSLLRANEFLTKPSTFRFVNLKGYVNELTLISGSLAFTYCQVPVVYHQAEKREIKIHYQDGTVQSFESDHLSMENSRALFHREGLIAQLEVYIPMSELR